VFLLEHRRLVVSNNIDDDDDNDRKRKEDIEVALRNLFQSLNTTVSTISVEPVLGNHNNGIENGCHSSEYWTQFNESHDNYMPLLVNASKSIPRSDSLMSSAFGSTVEGKCVSVAPHFVRWLHWEWTNDVVDSIGDPAVIMPTVIADFYLYEQFNGRWDRLLACFWLTLAHLCVSVNNINGKNSTPLSHRQLALISAFWRLCENTSGSTLTSDEHFDRCWLLRSTLATIRNSNEQLQRGLAHLMQYHMPLFVIVPQSMLSEQHATTAIDAAVELLKCSSFSSTLMKTSVWMPIFSYLHAATSSQAHRDKLETIFAEFVNSSVECRRQFKGN
jgi:hypothetical protein